MSEIVEFIFDLIFNLLALFLFEVPAYDFDVPDTRGMRIFLGGIIAALAVLIWTELR
jgi:hypothetical protein